MNNDIIVAVIVIATITAFLSTFVIENQYKKKNSKN